MNNYTNKRQVLSKKEKEERIEMYTELVKEAINSEGFFIIVAKIDDEKASMHKTELCYTYEALQILSRVTTDLFFGQMPEGIIFGS